MKKNIGFILFLSLLCGVTNANSAIVYQSDDRYINHSLGGTYTPVSPYATFNDDWWAYEAGAFQNTSVTSSTMSGSGSTYAGYDAQFYGAEATSVFSITFSVDQLTDFSLTGNLDTDWWGGSDLYVSLKENGTEIFGIGIWDLFDTGINPFSFDGQFATGNTYQLSLGSYSYDSNYYFEAWDFNLTTSPVPVPAAAWLFASGLLGLIGIAKRKRAA